MIPVKGKRKPRQGQKKHDENDFAVFADFLESRQEQGPLVWWNELSEKINGRQDNLPPVFEITRRMFQYICSLVEEDMSSKSPHYTFTNGKPMLVRDEVAVALRRLGSGDSLAIISSVFELSPPSVSQVTWRFVEAMESKALHHLQWPSSEREMTKIKSKFEKMQGLPNCCGVVDVTHITMCLSSTSLEPENKKVWLDHENKHSMVLQAIVDPDLRFRDIVTGWPGQLKDWQVFESSTFHKLCGEGERLNGGKIHLSNGSEIREYLIGDWGYPLLDYLIVPYKGKKQELSASQANFNKRHSETQMVAKRALRRLKEMWRFIQGTVWRPDKDKLPSIILACCLLHNIVIDLGNEGQGEQLSNLPTDHDPGYHQLVCADEDMKGVSVRQNLSLYMSQRMTPLSIVTAPV